MCKHIHTVHDPMISIKIDIFLLGVVSLEYSTPTEFAKYSGTSDKGQNY